MNGLRAQNPQAANDALLIEKIDSWLTCHNLTESFLIITNFLLLLKSSSNLVAIFNHSNSLIVDYNGSILFSDGFQWCFILVNTGVLSGSLLCLMALLFASVSKTKLRLLKYFVVTQLSLAFITLVLMGRLWFVPFKLELDSEAWKWTIRRYNYQYKPEANGMWPNRLPIRAQDPTAHSLEFGHDLANLHESLEFGGATDHDYGEKVDKLQKAFGCCGVWSPNEWRQNELLGLLAPSCCNNPLVVDVEFPTPIRLSGDQNETQPIMSYNIKQIFYCQSGGQSEPPGCQQQLNDKDLRFLFRLRLQLLLLIGILFLNVMSQALLRFDPIVDSTLILQHGLTLPPSPTPSLPPTYDQLNEFNQTSVLSGLPPSYQQANFTKGAHQTATSFMKVPSPGPNKPQADETRATQKNQDPLVTPDDLRLFGAIRGSKISNPSGGDIQNPIDTTVLTML